MYSINWYQYADLRLILSILKWLRQAQGVTLMPYIQMQQALQCIIKFLSCKKNEIKWMCMNSKFKIYKPKCLNISKYQYCCDEFNFFLFNFIICYGTYSSEIPKVYLLWPYYNTFTQICLLFLSQSFNKRVAINHTFSLVKITVYTLCV